MSDSWADYDEQLGYDADHTDDRQYCRHGTFIGSWWGPDYMCGYCESGEEPPTEAELAVMRVNKMLKIEAEFDKAVAVCQKLTHSGQMGFIAALAQALYNMAHTDYFYQARGLYIYNEGS